MNNIPILEIAISLIFVYFLLSIFVSGICELVNTWRASRAKLLKSAIDRILNDRLNKNWASLLYNHPLVKNLSKSNKKLPSYLSPNTFSSCLIDVIINEARQVKIDSKESGNVKYDEELPSKDSFVNFQKGLETLNYSDIKILLSSFINNASKYDELKSNIEKWYNDYMARVTGWFTRESKIKLFYIAITVTILFNINTIRITEELLTNKALRESFVEYAGKTIIEQNAKYSSDYEREKNSRDTTKVIMGAANANGTNVSFDDFYEKYLYLDSLKKQITSYDLPIGWKFSSKSDKIRRLCQKVLNKSSANDSYENTGWFTYNEFDTVKKILLTILGWLMTITALSFGAPFWFKLLARFINIRNTGNKPKNSQEKE